MRQARVEDRQAIHKGRYMRKHCRFLHPLFRVKHLEQGKKKFSPLTGLLLVYYCMRKQLRFHLQHLAPGKKKELSTRTALLLHE